MKYFIYLGFCLFCILISNHFLGAEAASCAKDWLQNQGSCYAYFDDKKTWHEADIDCQSYGRGAHLASILTESEGHLVAQHISTYQKDQSDVWIGLSDVRQNRKWRWADESAYSYRAWTPNQPDNYKNSEYCVVLRQYTGFNEWNDVSCKRRYAYICKHEL